MLNFKNNHYFKFFILFIILCAVCFSAIAFAETEKNSDSIFYRFGFIERPRQAKELLENAFEGSTIKVSNEELNQLIAKNNLIGRENAEETAIQFLLQREALYNLAISSGQVESDENVWAYIKTLRDAFEKENTIGKDDIADLISGTGLTADEYWNSQFDFYKKELTVSLYTMPIYESYANEHGINILTPEERVKWNEYIAEIAQNYIDKDDVKDIRAK